LQLTPHLLVIDVAGCSYLGRSSFRTIERAALALADRGAELIVRRPPPSFTLITNYLGDDSVLVVEPVGDHGT
jgi:anti-anti-sigma regulatory factor